MEIFMPDPGANPDYQDRKPKTTKAFSAFAGDHLAKGDPLKGGRVTIPFLRSEPRPRKSHPAVVDLVGNNYDDYIRKKGRASLSFFYMPTCPHCAGMESMAFHSCAPCANERPLQNSSRIGRPWQLSSRSSTRIVRLAQKRLR